MKTQWGLFLLASVVGTSTFAQDLNIVDVRRHITLSDDEVVYKDFYINGGEGDGLKKNLVVTAVRKIQVRDSSGSQTYGELLIPVGQLRVIAVYGKVAVAREYKLLSRDELPMLEQTGLMSGDRIDLKGAFVDDKRPVYKKKTAAAPANETAVVALLTTATATTVAPAPSTPTPTAATAQPTAPSTAKGPAPASVTAPSSNSAAVNPAKTAEAAVTKAQQ